MVRAALKAGINFFDTANEYAEGTSEEILGHWIKHFANRDEVVIATKAFWPWRNAPKPVDYREKRYSTPSMTA
jgi:aryl-alcohol dehydrogenase-like predicted oxidoreductase